MKRFLLSALFLGLFLSPLVRATEFLNDTFTDTTSTSLSSHTSDSGAAWTGNSFSGDYVEIYGGAIVSNRLAGVWVGFQWGFNMRAVVTPPSAEYDVTAVVHVTSVDGQLTINGRYLNAASYEVTIKPGELSFGHRYSNGSITGMGDTSFTWVSGHDYTVRLEIKDAVKNVYVDGVLQLSDTSENSITGAGSVAVAIGGGDATTGFQIDSITASTDDGSPPVVSGLTVTTGTVGTSFTSSILASNSPSSYALASGSLPSGLSLNTGTGVISGTPTGGSATFTVTATNAGGTSSAVSVTITVYPPSPVVSGLTVATTGFVLGWNASAGATLYEVRRDTTSLGTTTSTSMVVSGLTPGASYSISVRAKDSANHWSDWSSALVTDAIDSTNQIQLKIHHPGS